MSARAPFVPRPASQADTAVPDKARPPSSPPSYEPFRANGLLNAADHQGHSSQEHTSSHTDPAPPSTFKPLNLSGLARAKTASESQSKLSRSSSGSSLSRSPKNAHNQQKNQGVPRPSSPFFPNAAGLVSMNAFLAPHPPQSRARDDSAHYGDFSSNKAHIAAQNTSFALDDRRNAQHPQESDAFRFFESPLAAPRSRTVSHPSLASIHEVDEDGDSVQSRHAPAMGPPPIPDLGGFHERGFDLQHSVDRSSPSLRRPMKRLEPASESGEEHEYGAAAKRYKSTMDEEHQYPSIYGGRATPVSRHAPQPLHEQRHESSKQALYLLLGHDLDMCVEAHADDYAQARKKWSECTIDTWRKGGDDLAGKFAGILDFVKEHITTKLALYTSMEQTISQQKQHLSERDKELEGARENLVREGGAVVGESVGATKQLGEDA